jgi:hypothetical protein
VLDRPGEDASEELEDPVGPVRSSLCNRLHEGAYFSAGDLLGDSVTEGGRDLGVHDVAPVVEVLGRSGRLSLFLPSERKRSHKELSVITLCARFRRAATFSP